MKIQFKKRKDMKSRLHPYHLPPPPSPALPIDAMQITLLLQGGSRPSEKVQTSLDGIERSVHEISCSQTGGLYVLFR